MAHEKPRLDFEYTPPIERIPPKGLESAGVDALFAAYPDTKIGIYADRERTHRESMKWAQEAGADLLSTGESIAAVITEYEDPVRLHGAYFSFSTSEDVLSALYAMHPHVMRNERKKIRKDEATARIGKTATDVVKSSERDITWWKALSREQREFERRRSEATDALAEARREFLWTSKRIYALGLPSRILFRRPGKSNDQTSLVDVYHQYMDYFGDDARDEKFISVSPSLHTEVIIPKLIPLTTHGDRVENGYSLLDELSYSSRVVADDRTLFPDSCRTMYGTGDEYIDNHAHNVERVLQELMRRGYEQYVRSHPAVISKSKRFYVPNSDKRLED